MEWISSTTLEIFGWINSVTVQPETLLLAGMMLFLLLALSIGLAFALDREEPRAVRTIGWLILICSATAIGCSATGLLGGSGP